MTLRGENEETERIVLRIPVKIRECARTFLQGRWSFLGRGCEKKWYGNPYSQTRTGELGQGPAEGMMLNFAENGHPVFRATSPLEEGESRSKAKGKKSIHFNGSEEEPLN